MEEKYMVNDILEKTKSEILLLTDALINSENIELRQILAQIRSSLESFNSEIFTLASSKGYYFPDLKAKQEEIIQIRNMQE